MNCPSCGAPMRLKPDMDSFKCDYCHSVYFPERNDDGVQALEEPSGQDCSLCQAPLVHAVLAKMRIVYCTRCHGMLVAMQALESLVEQLRAGQGSEAIPAAPDKEDLQRKINCPQCHRPMDAHFYAGPGNVIIDSCETCSLIWLDRGELMRIARASDGTLLDPEPLPGDPGLDFQPDTIDQSNLVGNVRLVDSILSLIQT
jgi:Zn-finger nucleic acid-binding protein